MTAADKNRALDRNEAEWVEMSRAAARLTDAQLSDLLRRLRERRDRAQRLIRTRTRQASREGRPISMRARVKRRRSWLTRSSARLTNRSAVAHRPQRRAI
ncbi:hypothetical protein V8F63_08365 [Brevundimonas sp. LF-1]|uniref:hypothetical protein n=1 Tax=Brevundimonas sp. LF-1 TaxID=3126100 RepID=UPI0030DE896C